MNHNQDRLVKDQLRELGVDVPDDFDLNSLDITTIISPNNHNILNDVIKYGTPDLVRKFLEKVQIKVEFEFPGWEQMSDATRSQVRYIDPEYAFREELRELGIDVPEGATVRSLIEQTLG